jgi:hypothetical protein
VNDAAVTAAALPVFERLVGKSNVREISLQTTADDYSYFGQQVPSAATSSAPITSHSRRPACRRCR